MTTEPLFDDTGRCVRHGRLDCPPCEAAERGIEPLYNSVHVYVSTYCIHGYHDNCRLTCKVCEARCRCACHDTLVFDIATSTVRHGP